jgi:uncharacterized OsmC-like protein
MDQSQLPDTAEVQFNCTGTAVGKMRNELSVDMVRPFHEHFDLATDEGPFHGGEASAPPPLALFVAGLTGCLMTQVRAFAKRLKVPLDDLTVETRVIWNWAKAGRVYETGPKTFEIDLIIESAAPLDDIKELVETAKKGCFLEQTLGQANTIRHRLKTADGFLTL